MNYDDINITEKKQFFLDSVAKFCDKCGGPYSVDDVKILQDTKTSAIIHFSCHICKSKHIASFVAKYGISSRVPINTDLEVDEVQKFSKKKVLSLQNILDLYIGIKDKTKITI
ncbi:hypothetical protein GYA44_02490 [Candidatus Microgenomates bacterium]|nr:hypothetical protein [Candidatus Microgenomates bacterium]